MISEIDVVTIGPREDRRSSNASSNISEHFNNLHNQSSCKHVIIILSIVQMIMYLLDRTYLEIHPNKGAHISTSIYGPCECYFIFNPHKKYENFWQMWTYIFVHDSIHHIIPNLLIQTFFGSILEYFYGWREVIVVYVVGASFGSIAQLLMLPNNYLSGASGSSYAILSLLVFIISKNCSAWKKNLPTIAALLCFFSLDFGYFLYGNYSKLEANNLGDITLNRIHIAGIVAGLAIGFYRCYRPNISYTCPCNIKYRWSAIFLLAYISILCLFNFM